MNKAFVREIETDQGRCPTCGSLGTAVTHETLKAWLLPERLADLAQSGFFCPTPTCAVVYFDMFDRSLDESAIVRPVYPKSPAAPMCGCFEFGLEEIEADLAEKSAKRVRAQLEKAKSPDARCAIMAADGQCCVGEVQRVFLRMKAR